MHYAQIKDKNGDLVGRTIKCEVKKNKVAPPMRTMYYTIRWGEKPGAWIEEAETLWDSAIKCGVLTKVTAQKYRFKSPSTNENIDLTKRAFSSMIGEDENFVDDFKSALSEKYIITADNIADTVIEEVSDEEGIE
jgi:hypothetical protein